VTTAAAEIAAIERRYARRREIGSSQRYSPLDSYVFQSEQEKDAAIVRWLMTSGLSTRVSRATLLEIGCGHGINLLRFLRFGFRPHHIAGNELLPDRLEAAREVLPPSIRLISGDATTLDLAEERFDVVCLFTVLSSILDDDFQQRLAARAWSLVRPGGGVLCYDFIYNNPANGDVRRVSTHRLRELFPGADASFQKLTLAPPIGRLVTRWWGGAYTVLRQVPALRSHVLAWLPKDTANDL
jgi:SAM-dependent methyltransferase